MMGFFDDLAAMFDDDRQDSSGPPDFVWPVWEDRTDGWQMVRWMRPAGHTEWYAVATDPDTGWTWLVPGDLWCEDHPDDREVYDELAGRHVPEEELEREAANVRGWRKTLEREGRDEARARIEDLVGDVADRAGDLAEKAAFGLGAGLILVGALGLLWWAWSKR